MTNVVPAVISGIVALSVAYAGIFANARRQKEQTEHELKLQEERLPAELRTEFMAEAAIRQLLSHPAWQQRSFNIIKRKMGGSSTGAAFEDNELRKLLIRSGAVCFWKKQPDGGEKRILRTY